MPFGHRVLFFALLLLPLACGSEVKEPPSRTSLTRREAAPTTSAVSLSAQDTPKSPSIPDADKHPSEEVMPARHNAEPEAQLPRPPELELPIAAPEDLRQTPAIEESESTPEAQDPAQVVKESFERDFADEHTKGEHFGLYHSLRGPMLLAMLDRDGRYDPLWNLRLPTNWSDTECTLADVSEPGARWRRISHGRYPALHEDQAAAWDVAHSPFIVQGQVRGGVYFMRYRRADLNGDGKYSAADKEYFTVIENLDTGQEVLRLPNLADAPRPAPNGQHVLFRIFPASGKESYLQVVAWPGENAPPRTVPVLMAKVGEEPSLPCVSRPLWLSGQTFAFIAASSADGVYSGELKTVALNEKGTVAATSVLGRGSYPVETRMNTLLYNDATKELAAVVQEKEGKRLALYANPANEVAPQAAMTAIIPWLGGIRVLNKTFHALSGTQVLHVQKDGSLLFFNERLATRPWGMKDLGHGIAVMIEEGPGSQQPLAKGFGYTVIGPWPGKDGVPLTTDEDCRAQLPTSAWIASQVLAAKGVREAEAGKGLSNTVLAYDFEVFVEMEGIKKSSGTMLEFLRLHPRVMIRTEDDFGGDWIVKALSDGKGVLSDSKRRAFEPARGDVVKRLSAQLGGRWLLQLLDVETRGPGVLTCLGASSVRRPGSDRPQSAWLYARRYHLEEQEFEARLWFDREGEAHDMICAEVVMALGAQPQSAQLWFSNFGDLRDLSQGGGKPLRIPHTIEAFKPENGERVFVARFRKSLQRDTYAGGAIASGYNWPVLNAAHFSRSYLLEE